MYADNEYYKTVYLGTNITDETELTRALKDASDKIDTLTFNRVYILGIDKCTIYEQKIIKDVCCEIADFYFKNKSDLTTIINKYSLNGVSIEYGTPNNNITNINGITILKSSYQKLATLRFSYLGLGRC